MSEESVLASLPEVKVVMVQQPGGLWRCDVRDQITGEYKGHAYSTLSNLWAAFQRWHSLTEWPNTRNPAGIFSRQVETRIMEAQP